MAVKQRELTEWAAAQLRQGECPDCGGSLLKGPRGGGSVMVQCQACQGEFVIYPYPLGCEGLGVAGRAR